MRQNNFQKVFKTTKEANAILSKAGSVMLKSSFNTAKQIAVLYKEAGLKAFDLGKDVVKKTVDLALTNQKELIKTSGQAFKDVAQNVRESETEVQARPKGKAIDELLD